MLVRVQRGEAPNRGFMNKKNRKLANLILYPLYFPMVILWIIIALIIDLFMTRRWPGPGFKYIYVNEDGTARELTNEERQILTQKYESGDGARPNIKFGYNERKLNGKLSGFLKRRHLPWNIVIGPVEKANQ